MDKCRLMTVLLLICAFAQAMIHARNASIAFDEGPHLAVGYTTLRTRDLRLQPVHIHPPLANVLAAAPLLLQDDLPDPRLVKGWGIASLSGVTDAVVWQYPHPRRLAIAGRLPIILMMVLLGSILFRWASDLFGPRTGLVVLVLYAFDPNIIAHGSVITTDMGVLLFGVAALFLAARDIGRPRKVVGMGAGIALGLALAAKVSAISLLPSLVLLWMLGPRTHSLRRRILATLGKLALAGLTLWAAYGFEVRSLSGFPLPLPAATHISIFRSLQDHYDLGHPSFLMGQNRNYGWWGYFPVAFALKTPLVTLLLLGLAGVLSLCQWRAWLDRLRAAPLVWLALLFFPSLYAISALVSSVNIGYRHLLPILPFLFIFIGWQFTPGSLPCASAIKQLAIRTGSCGLLVLYIIGTMRISPNYLAYFNPLAGGPGEGYRYLVDSNLDWGQSLWQLRDWMQDRDVERIAYAHFSPARPEVYGIEADLLPPSPHAVSFAPFNPAPGTYAIGATVLQGVYTPDVNTFAWFRNQEPLERLGHAIFIYEVPPRQEPSWSAICADPAPMLSPERVQAGFGRSGLREILFDCRQSWIYPTGGQPGGIILPPGIAGPPGTVREISARHPDGSPLYDVYRVETVRIAPERRVGNVDVDGPLVFIGYQVDRTDIHPGEPVELQAFWVVQETPDRPLSLMAHLVGPDDAPIAVADGLGVPLDQWCPGDTIVQRHKLVVPDGTPPGPYSLLTGAYWLDTMERWGIRLEDGSSSDRLVLTELGVLE